GDGPDTYQVTEQWYFTAEEGEGEDICRVSYTVTSTDSRSDCELCDWAFDLVISDPEVLVDTDVGCEATVGVDSDDVAALDGTTVSYGYTAEYFGHAEVLFVEVDGAWTAVSNAVWDPSTGTFTYDWQDAYVAY
ncbi:MAG: hypothetical protein QGG40_09455, partial [Myxococcota bacterium]|nr:hypothetical protein [Myxococcota bacterium]